MLLVRGCDSTVTKALAKCSLFRLVGRFILCECCFAFDVCSGELKLLPFLELLCVCPVNHCWARSTRKCFPAVARALGSRLGSEGPRPKRGGGRFAQPRPGCPPMSTSHPRGCPQQARCFQGGTSSLGKTGWAVKSNHSKAPKVRV